MKDIAKADGPQDPKPSLEELQARSQEQRQELSNTLQALEQRLGDTADTVEEAVQGTQEVLQSVHSTVKTHRWAFVAGAVVFGAVVGSRKRSHQQPPPNTISPRRSLTGSLVSIAVGVAARQIGTAVATKILDDAQHKDDATRPVSPARLSPVPPPHED